MGKIKASKNTSTDVVQKPVEEKKTIDTSSKEQTEITIKKKIQELLQRLHVNQDKGKGLFEKLKMIEKEGEQLVGAIKYLNELLGELEQ